MGALLQARPSSQAVEDQPSPSQRHRASGAYLGLRGALTAPQATQPRHGVGAVLERIVLAIVTTLLSINLWTGFPILALWVGSQFVGSTGLSMLAVLIVLAVLAALMGGGLFILLWLNGRYNRVTGRRPPRRQAAPWLRAMSGERPEAARQLRGSNVTERIVVLTVVTATIVFEIWFFFFAGNSLPRNA